MCTEEAGVHCTGVSRDEETVNGYPRSPVPADQDLWPGELPFTAFGQHGVDHLDLRVFDQDVYWVDRYGTPHLLKEMSTEYRVNVIRHLETYATGFHQGTVLRELLQAAGDALLGRTSGEALTYGLDVATTRDLEPLVWLESTPLMRRLRRLTPDAGGA